jgi:lysophospholipase L1-like esterase
MIKIHPFFTAGILGMAAVGGTLAAAPECPPFPDVPEGHWAFGAVMRLKCAGIVQGSAERTPPIALAVERRTPAAPGGTPYRTRGGAASLTLTSSPARRSKRTGRMKIEAGGTLVMIGDSITDAGRGRPVGRRDNNSLGGGYVNDVDVLLGTAYADRKVRVLNTGISGHTVRDLKGRWQADVLDLKPDWLSIMIGTNDVWRQFDSPNDPRSHVYPAEYEATLDELVAKTKPAVKGLVLMTPFYVQPDAKDPMRSKMDDYGRIVQRIARKHNVIFVDTQAAFNEAMTHHHPLALAGDRVHPSPLGHMVLARAFLNAVGFEWR